MLNLTKVREEKGWTRTELARRAKMHPADIGKLEAGKIFAYEAWRKKLEKTLRVSSDFLFAETESGS